MRRVASVAATFAVAATFSASVSAVPAEIETIRHEAVHRHGRQLLSPFGIDLRQLFPFISETQWSTFDLDNLFKKDADDEAFDGEYERFLVFAGGDTWRNWAFTHAGMLWSPGLLANEGFTLKLLINGGLYRYVSGALNNSTVIGIQSSVTLMPGWRFKRAGYEIAVFAGLDVQRFRYVPVDPSASLIGTRYGLRGAVELWHEPSPTTMLAADASVSSIGSGNSARISFGWRVLDRFYLGPEAQVLQTEPYVLKRVGLHITALKLGTREWWTAGGYSNDNDHRSGLYIRFGVLMRK